MRKYLKIIFLSLVTASFFGCYIRTDPGKGKKIGIIVKLSKQGLFYKTWEGELIRGGLTDGSGTMGQSFHFVIEDDYLLKIALEAFEKQKEVIIEYECELISSCTRSEKSQPYFVKKHKYS